YRSSGLEVRDIADRDPKILYVSPSGCVNDVYLVHVSSIDACDHVRLGDLSSMIEGACADQAHEGVPDRDHRDCQDPERHVSRLPIGAPQLLPVCWTGPYQRGGAALVGHGSLSLRRIE